MAAEASIPGATNDSYATERPSNSTAPTSVPTPTPIDSRYRNGSAKPETNMYQ
jgi:hypothetical protein